MKITTFFTFGCTAAVSISDLQFNQQKTRILEEVNGLRELNIRLIYQITHYREQLVIYQTLYEREAEGHAFLQSKYKEISAQLSAQKEFGF